MISSSVGVAGSLAGADQFDRKSPVGPAVAVKLGNVGANRLVAAGLLLRLQDGIVIALKEVEELVLKAPFHRVEVPRGLGLAARLTWRRPCAPTASNPSKNTPNAIASRVVVDIPDTSIEFLSSPTR